MRSSLRAHDPQGSVARSTHRSLCRRLIDSVINGVAFDIGAAPFVLVKGRWDLALWHLLELTPLPLQSTVTLGTVTALLQMCVIYNLVIIRRDADISNH